VKYILGINGGFGGGYQDPSACLFAEGKLIAAVEEERLNKIKFSTGIFPLKSIHEVLALAGCSMQDVSTVAFHGSSWQAAIEADMRSYFVHHFGHCPEIRRFHHHDAHAASTYYLSGFDEALVVTADNSGDGISSQIMTGRNGRLTLLEQWKRPTSFGTFYSCITQLAGFGRDADEYKLMGLAPYGNPNAIDFSDVLHSTPDGGYQLNTAYIYPILPLQSFPNKQIPLYSKALLKKLHIENPNTISSELKRDLAASAQRQLENVVIEWINYRIAKTGLKHICFAGGVAMNCVLNQRIRELCPIDKLYVPPFAGDQGISIGAALLAVAEAGQQPDFSQFTPYTGRNFTPEEIRNVLHLNGIPYSQPEDSVKLAAQYIQEGKIIGWFQGKAEIGARALGNRSILANPAMRGMKDKINSKIKFREGFRPFCPSVLEEDFSFYFDSNDSSIPYMNSTVNCTAMTIAQLPEIVHFDNTARVQTVSSENNGIFHQLLTEVKNRTGHGMVINTSLNVRNQPMVYDVNDALTAFFTSGLDALFIENVLIEKRS
jgi:carbamoyltransferase